MTRPDFDPGFDPGNVPQAQHLLREGGTCSCFYRLPGDVPVLCGLPANPPHQHPPLAVLRTYELADFHPATGHLHACSYATGGTCDRACAGWLYALAEAAREPARPSDACREARHGSCGGCPGCRCHTIGGQA